MIKDVSFTNLWEWLAGMLSMLLLRQLPSFLPSCTSTRISAHNRHTCAVKMSFHRPLKGVIDQGNSVPDYSNLISGALEAISLESTARMTSDSNSKSMESSFLNAGHTSRTKSAENI